MASELKDAAFLTLMRERYELAVDYERENREEALDDLRFRKGDQWPDSVKTEREASGRPCLTINRSPQFIRQVTGDIRMNKPSVKVLPADSGSDPKFAEVYTGLIRHIEQASKAQNVYIRAAESSASCGMGFFRVVTEYSSDDAFDQDIRIKGIKNPFSVLFDPNAVEPTREDAKFCFVVSEIGEEEFKEKYPDANMADFESDEPAQYLRDWYKGKKIRIAEYWCKKPVTRTLGLLDDGSTLDLTEVADRKALPIVREREVESYKIEQYIVSGVEVLEGPHEWPGRYIPIVPVWGEEVEVGETTYRHGLIRFAKDAQRMYNYHRSAAVESIALQPKAPFVIDMRQVKGVEKYWNRANTDNLPYLPFTHVDGVPPPQRQAPPAMPAAMYQEASVAADDMKAVTGIYDAALGARSNETSGKAILARQQEGDVGTFIYIDNLANAIGYAGKILVDLIPRIYDSTRVVRVLGEDDSEEFVPINIPVQGEDGEMKLQNDISAGEYDVVVTTGPSFSTKRTEAAESMMAFMQSAPEAASMVMDLIVKNMDWPGSEELAKRFKKMAVKNGFAEPDDDTPPAEPPPPDPRIEMDAMKTQAHLAKTDAEIARTEEETESKRLENTERAMMLAMQGGEMQALMQEVISQQVQQILAEMQQVQQPPQGGFPLPEGQF